MKFKKLIIFFLHLTIFFYYILVIADEVRKNNIIDIPACINQALNNNRKIKIDEQKIIEAQHKIEEVKTAFYPNVSASFSYTRLEKAPSGGNGDANVYNTKLLVTYPLYTAKATEIGTEISELSLKSNEINLKISNFEIIYDVYQSYLNVLKADKYIDIANESIKLLKEHEKNIFELYSNGIITKNDLLSIKVKIAEAEQILLKALYAANFARVTLKQIVGVKIDSTLILKDYKESENFNLKYEECLNIAFNTRPEIKIYELYNKINEKKKDLTSTEDKLKLSLIGAYNIDEGGSSSDKKWALSLNASLPIWDHERVKHKILQDESRILQAQIQILEIKDTISLQVNQAYFNFELAKKELETLFAAINQAQENYKITEDKYKEGLITNMEVLDAHDMLTRLNINYFSAVYDYKISIASLKKAMGTLE